MKKVFSKFLAMMGMMSAIDVNPIETPTVIKHSKPRFVAGDHFYKHISMKRVGGKWRCKS